MSSLEKKMFKKSVPPPQLGSLIEEGNNRSSRDDSNEGNEPPPTEKESDKKSKFSPYHWKDYFDECLDVSIPNTDDIFRIYKTNPKKENGPMFVMHHGAGSSALTFGFVAKSIQDISQGECGVLAIDCRGHGVSKTQVFDSDFSLERLSKDLENIIRETIKSNQDMILVGHSMGGSVVVDVAQRKQVKNVIGVTVLDVVEGSAIDALSSMIKILSSRPTKFKSNKDAIKWSVQSDTIRNIESARLSIPALLEPIEDSQHLKWITNLTKTQPFWTEWFKGLSEKFLNSGTAKLLILAGTDRLDKTLIIGQMQGKFQLNIFPDAGHFLQEDAPLKTANTLFEFYKRNQRLVLPPKVKIN